MILPVILGLLVPIFLGYSLSLFFFKDTGFYEKLIISVTSGFGILFFVIFVLNQVFGIKFDFTTSIILLIILFVLGVIFMMVNIRGVKKEINLIRKKKETKKWKENPFIKIIILVFLVIILYKSAFFPMVGVDALDFHAPIIKETFETGYLPTDVGPQVGEMERAFPTFFTSFGAWMNILNQEFNDIFIRLIPVLFGILVLMVTYALARDVVFKNKRKALLAVLLLLTFPMFVNFSILVSKDTMFAFFSVATIYLIMKYLQSRKSPYLVFGLITLAFTTQVKHLGMPLTISVILGLLFILYYKKVILCFKKEESIANIIQSKETKMLLLGVLLFIIIVSPYYIRNAIVFKDPVYPYLTYLPPYLEGKNFVPFLFESTKIQMESAKLFYSPEYFLFGIRNFIGHKAYSMSVFFLILLIFTLFDFKKMKKEQKYLLYFSVFYTIYYVYSFLLKYRYYMAIVPLLCVVVAGKFDTMLRFKLGKKEKRFFLISLIFVLLILIAYFVVLLNKESIIGILGFRAEHFLSSIDVVILMHLIVPIIALFFLLSIKNIKVKSVLLILILLVPSLYGLAYIRCGLIDDISGTIDQSKDLELFKREVLKPIPSKEALLSLNLGEFYDAILFLNKNTPKDAKIVSYNAMSYYTERPIIPIDSYKMEKSYTTNLSETLALLKELNITHILYKKLGWDETVSGTDKVRNKSYITKNLNNTDIFRPIYRNNEYVIYKLSNSLEND